MWKFEAVNHSEDSEGERIDFALYGWEPRAMIKTLLWSGGNVWELIPDPSMGKDLEWYRKELHGAERKDIKVGAEIHGDSLIVYLLDIPSLFEAGYFF